MNNRKKDLLGLITEADKNASTPLADIVYQNLLEAIYQGVIPQGSAINEVTLAKQFGISRGPIREAIRRLQGIQLITREPYTKARVVTLSHQAVVELFQLRMALEGMACRLAARNLSDAELQALSEDLYRMKNKQGREDLDFHMLIIQACGNQRIINMLCHDLYYLLRLYRSQSGSIHQRKEDAYDEHLQILKAIRNRDELLAEFLMRSHIEEALKNLSDNIPLNN